MAVRGAPFLVLACLVFAAFAGCTSPPPKGAETVEVPTDTGPREGFVNTEDAANATQPADQSEFAKSLDDKFHVHNYWGGALEKTIMDVDVDSGSLLPDLTRDITQYFFEISLSDGVGITQFHLPEGDIVPPEADHLEVTVSWTAAPTITGLQFGYSTAQDVDLITRLDPMPEGGSTFPIATNLTQNDIPHTTISMWRFWLFPVGEAPNTPGVFNGTVHVLIKAFRQDILLVAPPHKDFWGKLTSQDLFESTGVVQGTRAVVPVVLPGKGDAGSGTAEVEPPNGTIVPPHTGLLTVVLEWSNTVAVDPFQTRLELYYAPPATYSFLLAQPATVSDTGATYTIPVDPSMWDSPYAEHSEWTFLLSLDTDAATDQGTGIGDIGSFDGTFTIKVSAEREQAT